MGDPCGVYGIMYFDPKQGLFYKDHGICYYDAYEIPEDDTIDESAQFIDPILFIILVWKQTWIFDNTKENVIYQINQQQKTYVFISDKQIQY